ncbi:MAG: glycosyltransferase [Lachnospiraceae bacterium]|nr:glycosyltransferase [Lachnospiraceae bacterium]
MKLQVLVSAMHKEPKALAEKMNLCTEAVIINQCDTHAKECFTVLDEDGKERNICAYSFCERGVGLSRNNALLRATADISLFSDDDIIYDADYEKKILEEFAAHKDADVLLFNVEVNEKRRTYYNTDFHRVRWYNCGRYPAYAIAIKTEKMHSHNLTFSLLFGGGAKYSNGEDSLFLVDCLKAGLKLYASPVKIGKEEERNSGSTWFSGYNKKFFYDRGVLYRYLYGAMAKVFGLRFLLKIKKQMCGEVTLKQAYMWLKEGIYFAKTGKEKSHEC